MISDGFWVFAYGSLLWKPGFEVAEARLGTLHGYHRSFCMTSIEYRGTPEKPGLVLALDALEGATCTGLAYRVEAAQAEETYAYLTARELVTAAYRETRQTIALAEGGTVEAIAYVMDTAHGQYAGALPLDAQAKIIADAIGPSGPNAEYLHNTVAALGKLGIRDPDLEALDRMVRARVGGE
ncbi:cation transport protein ChaC [Rubricella aquisinus]|uniref:glutathione-specific gamma-glutamylcyclotransferase n=1 Tax=Rubricella aquisinus TaxID=2028108 RepID=A0A840WGP8_9RHOB|nr:gamma-glutamylcyclotransferase [Rubricella aquisinus]MBB5514309.1 cation transport protein ChaC [Rubricella aquisinus]